jgi:hypothetical protein
LIRESRRSQWLSVFRKKFAVKGLRPPEAALRALDGKFLSKLSLAIAIDGGMRPKN